MDGPTFTDQVSAEMDDGWQRECVFACLRACACVYLCFWWVAGVTTRVVGGWGSGLSWEITPVLRSRGGYRRQVVFLGGPLNLFLKSHRITQTEIEPAD